MKRRFIRKIQVSGCVDDSYIFEIPAIKHLIKMGGLSFDQDVTFLIGENGSGKSTLAEAVAVSAGMNGEGGSKNFNFATCQTVSGLHNCIKIIKSNYEKDSFFLRAESLFNVASQIDSLNLNISNYGGKSLHSQSHGESFLALLQNRFRGHGLYILDEPEAALSLSRQLVFLSEIKRLVDDGSQFIIATHSPIILSFPGAVIYSFSEKGIENIPYFETENYKLTKQFLDDPEQFLKYLLAD